MKCLKWLCSFESCCSLERLLLLLQLINVCPFLLIVLLLTQNSDHRYILMYKEILSAIRCSQTIKQTRSSRSQERTAVHDVKSGAGVCNIGHSVSTFCRLLRSTDSKASLSISVTLVTFLMNINWEWSIAGRKPAKQFHRIA